MGPLARERRGGEEGAVRGDAVLHLPRGYRSATRVGFAQRGLGFRRGGSGWDGGGRGGETGDGTGGRR